MNATIAKTQTTANDEFIISDTVRAIIARNEAYLASQYVSISSLLVKRSK